MIKPSEQLKARLRQVFMDFHAEDSSPSVEKQCAEFVFHMTDWLEDLRHISSFYSDPESLDDDGVRRAVTGLLYHASAHIAEAARLYDFFPDHFQKKEQ